MNLATGKAIVGHREYTTHYEHHYAGKVEATEEVVAVQILAHKGVIDHGTTETHHGRAYVDIKRPLWNLIEKHSSLLLLRDFASFHKVMEIL